MNFFRSEKFSALPSHQQFSVMSGRFNTSLVFTSTNLICLAQNTIWYLWDLNTGPQSQVQHIYHKRTVLPELFYNLSLCMRKSKQFVFPAMSDTNQPVQSQKQARSLKFWIEETICVMNTDVGQPCNYFTADLHLCFCL